MVLRRGERGTMNGESSSPWAAPWELLRLEPDGRASEGGLRAGDCALRGGSSRAIAGRISAGVRWARRESVGAPSSSVLPVLLSFPFLLRLKMRFGLADGEGRAGWLWDIWDLVPRDMERLSLSAVLPMARLTMLPRDSGEAGMGGVRGDCAGG